MTGYSLKDHKKLQNSGYFIRYAYLFIQKMFKIYGVTDPKKTTKSPSPDHHGHDDNHAHTDHEQDHSSHDHAHTTDHAHESKHTIDVAIHNESDHETDIGQIAVDILDTTSSIIIIAPIA